MSSADLAFSLELDRPIDVPGTVALVTGGGADPTARRHPDGIVVALRTAGGALTLRFDQRRLDACDVAAWGPGAAEAEHLAADLAGGRDVRPDPSDLDAALARYLRRASRRRLPAGADPFAQVLLRVPGQRVTAGEAAVSHRQLVAELGEAAPGPHDLVLPPGPAAVADVPVDRFHRWGIERRRARTIRAAAGELARLGPEGRAAEAVVDRLARVPGLGAWTMAQLRQVVLADSDAVVVGDYHLPSVVAWNLAGEARADDERMLELLAPAAPVRGRLQRAIAAFGRPAPAYGPRRRVQPIRSR